jgi:hypothetical protein
MPQGEGASLLIRVWSVTKDDRYIRAAEKALELMLTGISNGGTARQREWGLCLEEDPTGKYPGILNGWVFAVFGLYDGVLATGRLDFTEALENTVKSLVSTLTTYDAGFWSFYDLSGHLASPFYYELHIAQLKVLHDLFWEREFADVAERWSEYRKSVFRRSKAFLIKAMQKLREPGDIIIVR